SRPLPAASRDTTTFSSAAGPSMTAREAPPSSAMWASRATGWHTSDRTRAARRVNGSMRTARRWRRASSTCWRTRRRRCSPMRALVRQAMEEGALGVTTALIYSPNDYARTPELIALASESARCGGIYSVHMRSEGDRLIEAVQETVDIARTSGAPAEIYHLKAAGKRNWNKLDALIHEVQQARTAGIRITADMYVYTAGATGFDAAMPPWVQDGGLEAWIARLKDRAVRSRVLAEMRDPAPAWENLYGAAGAAGTLLLGFKNPALKPPTGRTLADVAQQRGVSPEEAVIDLVVEDGSRVAVAYFLMSEENVR